MPERLVAAREAHFRHVLQFSQRSNVVLNLAETCVFNALFPRCYLLLAQERAQSIVGLGLVRLEIMTSKVATKISNKGPSRDRPNQYGGLCSH